MGAERSKMNHKSPSLAPLISLLVVVVMLIPLDTWLLGLPVKLRVLLGGLAAVVCAITVARETAVHRRRFVALGVAVAILTFAPVHTSLAWGHIALLGTAFVAVLVIPTWIVRDRSIIAFKLLPDRIDKWDVFYTFISIFLAWGAFKLYFGPSLSPEVPYNWYLPAGNPDTFEVFKLFMGINAVGIWDELFFINICFATIRSMYGFRVSNMAQAVIYTTVLCDMAFTGWGPVFVGFLAITQGYMYERSRVLLWVLIVHLIVDYFLFQAIVGAYYPELQVWWHL
jgi:hypothetical protein